MIAEMAGPYMAGSQPKDPHKVVEKVRSSQLFAFVGVNPDMKVIYSHYFRSLTDFPNIKDVIKGMKSK